MYPYIKIFGCEILSYWIAIYTGILLATILIIYKAAEYNINRFLALIIFLFTIYTGLVFAHFTSYLIYYPKFIFTYPCKMFIFWEGGLTAFGGIIGAMLGLLFVSFIFKISFFKTFDLFTLPSILGFMIGRIGCFLNGCCYGIATNLFWGVTFTNSSSVAPLGVKLHPTQLYEFFGWFIVFVYIWYNEKHKNWVEGELFLRTIVGYSIIRFILERFRADSRFIPHTPIRIAQLVSLILIIVGVFCIKKRREMLLEKKPQ